MIKKYYIIDDVWEIIKSFMYHNIKKHGKHLMIDDKNICKYNEVVKSIPIIQIPISGPRIIYNSASNKFRVAKFLYYGSKFFRIFPSSPYYNTIIEYVPLKQYKHDCLPGFDVASYYRQNAIDVKSKLK